MKLPPALAGAACALALSGLGPTFGQVVNQPASRPATPDETVELSPFVVTSGQDEGYQAANTMAGSRMNTSLRDTAASVSVMTEELLRDVGALNLDQAIAFATNVEFEDFQFSNDNASFEFFSQFRIRGQVASVGRNYFRWRLPTNTFNVERIEEARGPNSILFGIASAGGMISTQTKQAFGNRNFRKGQFIYGSYDLRRASFDLNQSGYNGKFGLRFNAVADRSQGYQHHVFNEDTRAHLALKWNVSRNTVVRAEYEKGQTRSNKAKANELNDNLMRWFNAGRPVLLVTATNNALGITRNGTGSNLGANPVEESPGVFRNYDMRGLGVTQAAGGSNLILDPAVVDPIDFEPNVGGPRQIQSSWFDTYSALVDHRLFKNTSLQLAYNRQASRFSSWQARNSGGLKGDPNKFLYDGVTPNPHAGGIYLDVWWTNYTREDTIDNLRFTASQDLNLGKWGEYRLAGLAEREESRFLSRGFTDQWFDETNGRGAFNAAPTASANRVTRRNYITLGQYDTYVAGYTTPGDVGPITGLVDPSNPARKIRTDMMMAGGFDDPQQQDTYLLAGQAFFIKRKLVLAGGYRYDTLYLHENQRGTIDPATLLPVIDEVRFPRNHRTVDAKTKTMGAVFHALPWVSLRYNRSNSNELADTRVRLVPKPDANGLYRDSRVGDNPKGEGKDYGVEITLFDGKVNLRGTRFETTRVGAQGFTYGGSNDNPTTFSERVLGQLESLGLITFADHEARKLNTGGSTYDVASTGYEFSLIANVTKNWRMAVNYSITDSVTDSVAPEIQAWAAAMIPYFQKFNQSIPLPNGLTIAQEIERWQSFNQTNLSVAGVSTVGNRREKASVVTRYAISNGMLKGFHFGGAVSHVSKGVVGAMATGQSVYGNSFSRTNAFCGYRFGRIERLKFLKDLSVQLNINNVLDQREPLIIRYQNVNVTPLVPSQMAVQPPRFWQLSANFEF